MDHPQLPAISEEEFAAEIELFDKAKDPDEVDRLLSRWLIMYLPKPRNALDQEPQEIKKIRITYTDKMNKLAKIYRRIMEHQRNITVRKVLLEQRQLTVPTSNPYATPAGPNASRPSVIKLAVGSNGGQHTAPRITYNGNYNSTIRNAVINGVEAQPNSSMDGIQSIAAYETVATSSGTSHVTSSTTMQMPILTNRVENNRPSSTSTSLMAATQSMTTSIPTENNTNVRNLTNNGQAIQSTNTMETIGSVAAYETVATSTGSSIGISNAMEIDRTASTSTAALAFTQPEISSITMRMPIVHNSIRFGNAAENDRITSTPTFTPPPPAASSLPMRIPNLPSTSSSSVTAPPAHSTGTPSFTGPLPVASSLPMRIPNLPTTSRSSVTPPPAHSTGTPIFNPPRPAASSTPMQTQNLPPTDDCKYTVIGPNGTTVSSKQFKRISFKLPSTATRNLLCLVFSEYVLAKNTLSGKPSPAFKNRERPLKGQLDPDKVSDIIYCVRKNTTLSEKNVRTIITTKCADSTKKMRRLSQPPKTIE
ncbi:integrator complex subunit 6 homolog isoform X1 [Bactrocera dorsalis]|uniref:Integrator complex subunit 6 homolog isoform X1 n=1 Tax=Bactrocera dorsalis TaxID=27457 RepID=A0ABM3JKB3_BACDO|nr:integrator complex subunit 6 homolog isoform X1 [Bactrocera dorsalis]